jgi:hypothetical protein
MGRMKEVKTDIESMLGNGYHTYEQITDYLSTEYGISKDFAFAMIEVIIAEWDADERQMEINFESNANV